MRELALVGLICTAFGLGAYRGTGELGFFVGLNLVVGAAALAAALVIGVRRFAGRRANAGSGPVWNSALGCIAVIWGAVLVQQAASLSQLRFDWTFEGRYELAPATRDALGALSEPLIATLYLDREDPRIRRTRLLLAELARHGNVVVRERDLDSSPEDEDRYAIRSSNSVVLQIGARWERVDRPEEGALFEAISYLGIEERRILYVTVGAGEGNIRSLEELGYSGLGAALETEGYQLRLIQSAIVDEIPGDADGVLMIAPERRLHPRTAEAISNYLVGGGSLIVFLEPDRDSGLDELLTKYGIEVQPGIVVDPESGSVDGRRAGTDLVAFNYAKSDVTRGLNANRRTYFPGTAGFRLRKPEREDQLRSAVLASGDSWIWEQSDLPGMQDARPRREQERTDFHPLVVTGQYERDGREVRIVAFGDSHFANNANLRTLYNLDLAMNAVHWCLQREARITLRPKAGSLIQFPLPLQSTLKAFYGVGLLVPELLLLMGGAIWLRRRSA